MKRPFMFGSLGIATVSAVAALAYRTTELGRTSAHASADSRAAVAPALARPEQETSDEARRLGRELSALRAELTTVREQISQKPWQRTTGSSEVADPDPGLAELEERVTRERAWTEHMANVEAAFRGETKDTNWSYAKSEALRTALENDTTLRDLAREIDCRSRTCRMEIADDRQGGVAVTKDLPAFAQAIVSELTQVQATRIQDGRGGTTTVLYMSNGSQPETSASR